jgi:hypothetical protein
MNGKPGSDTKYMSRKELAGYNGKSGKFTGKISQVNPPVGNPQSQLLYKHKGTVALFHSKIFSFFVDPAHSHQIFSA